jgi:methyl-accepting chemotaxis protein
MAPNQTIEGFQARLTLYDIDEQARSVMQETWTVIAPLLERAIDEFLVTAVKMPRIAEIIGQRRPLIKKLEMSHFEALLSGRLDERYVESCQKTVIDEAAIGFDGRVRSSAGNFVLRAVLDALARRHRFSTAGFVLRAKVVSQFIAFDNANAMSLHRAAAEQATEARRKGINGAIADFDGAIGEVITAIKEAVASLASSSSTLREVADNTVTRMASAASAATETKARVQLTAAAAEEISSSINHIGQQTMRSLDIARSAVGDTQRTQNTIRALHEAAEQIGSVVGLISTIASQTNLLALNATIEAARAGQGGKGFAVVASEVKVLAGQTSKATEAISKQVAAIQEATKRSLDEISSIARTIDELTAAATGISSAVEEQSSTIREIASSVQTIAGNTAEASVEIRSVEEAAGHSAAAVGEIAGWTARLSSRANDLETKVATFFAKVRAA